MKRRNVLKLLGCLPFVGWLVPKKYKIHGLPVKECTGAKFYHDGYPVDFGTIDDYSFGLQLAGTIEESEIDKETGCRIIKKFRIDSASLIKKEEKC